MKLFIIRVCTFLCMLFLPFANSHAFVVGASEGGLSPGLNLFTKPLELSEGSHLVDFYFDTEGDISWGWDLDFNYVGDISMVIVPGAYPFGPFDDIAGNPGAPTDDGYRQIGGFPLSDRTGVNLLFTAWVIVGGGDASLQLTGLSSYTSGNTFSSESIVETTLVVGVSEVPLPPAAVLYLSAFAVCAIVKRKI